jgi:hypothetical protein
MPCFAYYTTTTNTIQPGRANWDFLVVTVLFTLFQIKYTGFRDRPHEERQLRFQTDCREGHADVVSSFIIHYI